MISPTSVFDYPSVPHSRRHGPRGYLDHKHYKPWLRDEFSFRCVYCLCRETWFPDGDAYFGGDHVWPRSREPQGLGGYDSLVYACCVCNACKKDFPELLDCCAVQVTGLELQVSIDREDKPMRLTFGVILRGVTAPHTAEQANRILDPTLGQFRGMRKFTYPVCLFFFTLRDETALFSWLAEPVVRDGAPKLIHHNQANCTPLTDDLLGQVIEQILTWYDAVETVLIA